MKSTIFALLTLFVVAMAEDLQGAPIQFPGGLVAKDHSCSDLDDLNAAFYIFQEEHTADRNLRGDSSELVTLSLSKEDEEAHRNLYNCGRYCSCCGASWCCMICGWGCRRRAEDVNFFMEEEGLEMPGCLAGASMTLDATVEP